MVFLYNYRYNANQNISKVISYAQEFLSYYDKTNTRLVLMYQDINTKYRGVDVNLVDNIYIFKYSVEKVWGGNEGEVFWALIDDDLIQKMLSYIKGDLKFEGVL